MNHTWCWLGACLLLSFPVGAQDFTYFVLGAEDLGDSEIYSILPLPNGQFFVSTDQGVYAYRQGRMQRIRARKETQRPQGALFSLATNSQNKVFGVDLNGAVFQVAEDSLAFLTQVPKEYLASEVYLEFDQNDRLVFLSAACLVIEQDTIIPLHVNEPPTYWMQKLLDGQLLVTFYQDIRIGMVGEDSIAILPTIPAYEKTTRSMLQFDDQLFAVNHEKRLAFDLQSNRMLPILGEIPLRRCRQYNKEEAWALYDDEGMARLTWTSTGVQVSERKLAKEFISIAVAGPDGTLYLGTFGSGILVVPNTDMLHHTLAPEMGQLTDLAVTPDNTVYLLDKANGIHRYENDRFDLLAACNPCDDRLFYDPGYHKTTVPQAPGLYMQQSLPGGADKDVTVVDSNTLLVVASTGVKGYGTSDVFQAEHWTPTPDFPQLYTFNPIQERCTSVAYDMLNKVFFVATLDAVLQVNKQGEVRPLHYQGEVFTSNDLVFRDGVLYLATQEYGVLVYRDGQVSVYRDQKGGLKSNYVKQIQFQAEQLFLSFPTGFQVVDLQTDRITNLGVADGLMSGSVKDFAVSHTTLWLLTNNQLLSVELDKLKEKTPDIKVALEGLQVEGIPVAGTQYSFAHNQNDFIFELDFRGVLFEKEADIQYRLQGLEADWRTVSATTPVINYSYLPPGTYEFQLRGQYRDHLTAIQSHPFKIRRAFWQNPWFYGLLAMVLIVSTVRVVQRRNLRIQRENERRLRQQTLRAEAVANELKALKAQMNPHFIFNSLNAIQDLILQQDTTASYDYIELFASLIRRVLAYSDQPYLPLEEEIHFLETYLQLAQLRFGQQSFNYQIDCPVDQAKEIPSLILQPLVENALQHGLFHKEGSKQLRITFHEDDMLYCTITDNGIGRAAAQAILDRQGRGHASFALAATQKRLQILAANTQLNLGFELEDCYENGQPAGTRVIVRLPLR